MLECAIDSRVKESITKAEGKLFGLDAWSRLAEESIAC
jgi:hypothetical protein